MNDQPQNTAIISESWNPQRGADGKFLPGQGGRPKNSRNRFAAATMQEIKDLTAPAIAALSRQVDAGNMDAVRFVLERVVGRNRMIELEGGSPSNVTEALINGEISTEEAKSIATVVEKLRRVEDMDALAERLAAVEKLLRDESL